jgi:pyridoxine 5-phosphate synthase
MPKLCVNVDHIATIREARKTFEPDPVAAAILAELAGADGIVVHLREDRRHIRERDVEILRKVVVGSLNLEMAPTDEMVKFAKNLLPDHITLVPERREELTTEGGLDVIAGEDYLKTIVSLLKDSGIKVSIFIDPDVDQVKKAVKCKADMIEVHTGRYAEARTEEGKEVELERIRITVSLGNKLGLIVHAGHGLNYQNVRRVAKIPGIIDLNIGHSIISRAVLVGMDEAVRTMLDLINSQ